MVIDFTNIKENVKISDDDVIKDFAESLKDRGRVSVEIGIYFPVQTYNYHFNETEIINYSCSNMVIYNGRLLSDIEEELEFLLEAESIKAFPPLNEEWEDLDAFTIKNGEWKKVNRLEEGMIYMTLFEIV